MSNARFVLTVLAKATCALWRLLGATWDVLVHGPDGPTPALLLAGWAFLVPLVLR